MKSSPPYTMAQKNTSILRRSTTNGTVAAVRYSFAVDLEINLIDLPTDGQFIYYETFVTVCGFISE